MPRETLTGADTGGTVSGFGGSFGGETLSGSLVSGQAPAKGQLLALGTLLNGRYQIMRVLGQGGMGVVYLATDTLRGQDVAIKTIRGSLFQKSQLSMFKAEFKVMAGLSHPNIASVYDFEAVFGSDDYFFTMENVVGDNALNASSSASMERKVDVLVDVCRALSYIHDHRIIHFDVKPANIVIGASGTKVLDFGLVAARMRAGARGVVGTPSYIAPEIVLGSDIDHRADLYSLGMTAYHLLCRRVPFEATDLRQLFQMQCVEPVVFTPDDAQHVPAWLQAIILRLVEKEPAARYRNAGEVIRAINRAGGLTYEVATAETKESYILSSRFTGREAELETLVTSALTRSQGRGGNKPAHFVAGSSGLGKSRLMREVRHVLQLSRLSFIEAACYETEASEFGALAEVFRHLVALAASAGGDLLIAKHGPELVKIVPTLGSERALAASPNLQSPRHERLRLLEQVTDFVLELSELTPIIIYVNDLQWAPSGAAEVLTYLLHKLRAGEEAGKLPRVTLFGSYRSDEVEGRPLQGLLDAGKQRDLLDVITLTPLTTAQVSAVLSSMIGIEDLPPAFARRVHDESSGNPFFIEEVMRALVENGSVFLVDGKWSAVDAVEKLDIPASIATVFLRRTAQLDSTARHVLDVLAVCAAPVGVRVLERVTGLDNVQAALVDLASRQMVVPHAASEYTIAHDRMREAVYGALDATRRKELHARTAEALEAADPAERAQRAEQLAYHYARAGSLDRAIAHGKTAAACAEGQRLFSHALELYDQVDAWLAQLGVETERLRILFEASRLADLLGDRRRTASVLSRLLDLTNRVGSPGQRVKALICQGEALTAARQFDEAAAVLDKAHLLALKSNDAELERSAVRSLGFHYWQAGEYARATEYNERCLALERARGDANGIYGALLNLGATLRGMGEHERALVIAKEAQQQGRAVGDVKLLATAAALLASLHSDPELKLQAWRQDADAMREYPVHDVVRSSGEAATLWQMGRVDESIAVYEHTVTVARAALCLSELARNLRTLGEIHASKNDDKPALGCFVECAAVFARMDEFGAEADARLAAADLELATGNPRVRSTLEKAFTAAARAERQDLQLRACEALGRVLGPDAPDEAEHYYALALSDAEALGQRPTQANILNSLAILAWKNRRYDAAVERYERALQLLEPDDDVHRAFIHNSVAVALRSLERPDEAESRFAQALQLGERSGDRMVVGHALAGLGDLAHERGDDAKAMALYRRSLALRDEIGDTRGKGWMAFKLSELLAGTEAREMLEAAHAAADACGDAKLSDACSKGGWVSNDTTKENT